MSVVYVAGTMRSGTTALGQALAASPDLLLLGEVRPVLMDLREPGEGRCDCGELDEHCSFWSRLLPLPSVREAATVAFATRSLPALLLMAFGLRRKSSEVQEVVARLQVLGRLAGDRTIVDTSKTATGIVLWLMAGHRVHIAHCLRSPRVVVAKQAASTRQSGLPVCSRTSGTAIWVVHNLLAWALQYRAGCDRVAVPYRAWCADPAAVVARVWELAAVRSGSVDATGGHFADVFSHMLAGNPRRDRSGSVRVRSSRRGSAPTELVQAGVVDPEVVGEFVHDRHADLVL